MRVSVCAWNYVSLEVKVIVRCQCLSINKCVFLYLMLLIFQFLILFYGFSLFKLPEIQILFNIINNYTNAFIVSIFVVLLKLRYC